MPPQRRSRTDLENRIGELEAENEMLNDKLDSIRDIAEEDDSDDSDDADNDQD